LTDKARNDNHAAMTADEVRSLIRDKVAEAGSLRAWGAQAGVSAAYLSDVLNGNREPGETVAAALGLRKVVSRGIEFVPAESAS
jgi:hypothetical protein